MLNLKVRPDVKKQSDTHTHLRTRKHYLRTLVNILYYFCNFSLIMFGGIARTSYICIVKNKDNKQIDIKIMKEMVIFKSYKELRLFAFGWAMGKTTEGKQVSFQNLREVYNHFHKFLRINGEHPYDGDRKEKELTKIYGMFRDYNMQNSHISHFYMFDTLFKD